MDVNAQAGALTMIHAENFERTPRGSPNGSKPPAAEPRHHAESRPMAVEREATHRAIALSEIASAPLRIVHVSGREAVGNRRARARGINIFAETCPQDPFLSDRDLDQPWCEVHAQSPPRIRESGGDRQGIEDGLFAIFSSTPRATASMRRANCSTAVGHPSARSRTASPAWRPAPPLLFSEGVMTGRISLQRFVALNSANAARLYGSPPEGTIAVGAYVDLADPATGQ